MNTFIEWDRGDLWPTTYRSEFDQEAQLLVDESVRRVGRERNASIVVNGGLHGN